MPTCIQLDIQMKPAARCNVLLDYKILLCILFCLWLPSVVLVVRADEEVGGQTAGVAAVKSHGKDDGADAVAADSEQEVQ